MKYTPAAILIAAIAMLLATPARSFALAPDTVTVAPFPVGNINNTIAGDTLANGQRAHPNRVYKLYRDSIYYFTGTINISYPLTIFADTGSKRPPVVAPAILQDNSSPSPFLNVSSGSKNVTLKNLYMLGVRPDQVILGWASCINITSDSTRFTIDKCVIDNFGSSGVSVSSGRYNKFFITNCTFRNMMHQTSWFGGQPFFGNSGAPTDTVMIINNTMFCNNSYADCNVDYNVYTRFEHNTVFLTTVNPLNDFAMTDAHYLNNIFYGTCAESQTKDEIAGWWFDDAPYGSSTFSFDSLNVYLPKSLPITEAQRHITIRNNNVSWPQKLKDFWKTPLMDTLIPPVFMNGRTLNMFSNHTGWPGLWQSGNDTLNDPGFPSSVMGQVDSLTKYVRLTRTGGLATYLWYYNPNNQLFPPAWPLPENLRYTNTALQHAGTDGYALGDLNWFPEQKATWTLTGVKTEEPVPEEFTLSQNYPNPFNPSTNIRFTLKNADHVRLLVYSILGQKVRTLADQEMMAGSYVATWDGRDDRGNQLSSGVYFYRLETKSLTVTRNMLLLK